MMTASDLLGFRVIESPLLPMYPDHKVDARRNIRHLMADVLGWLGEDVGPKPGEPTQVILMGDTLLASAAIVGSLRGAEATS